MAPQLGVTFTGLQLREPVPARLRAADRVRQQHHARLRRRLGRRRHQDDRPASGGQRRRAQDEVPARHAGFAAPVDAEAAGHGAALVVELGAHFRQDARLVGAAHRAASRRRIPTRILVASIMAGSGSDEELAHWQTLATACQDAGRRNDVFHSVISELLALRRVPCRCAALQAGIAVIAAGGERIVNGSGDGGEVASQLSGRRNGDSDRWPWVCR